VSVLIALSSGAGGSGFASYSTNFDGTENPLDEAGMWLTPDAAGATYWQPLRKSGGRAFGVGTTDAFEDCVEIINPAEMAFGADHVVRAAFHITSGYTVETTHEAQIILRGAFGNDHIEGYEILFQLGASKPTIMKWYGPGGGGFFAELTGGTESDIGFQHGDICIAQVSGTNPALIEVFRDRGGVVQAWRTVTDNGSVLSGAPILTSGQPGLASFSRIGVTLDAYAWDSFSASDDPGDFQ
jgi:hypothetical protein